MSQAFLSGAVSTASVAQPPRRRADAIKYAWARGIAPNTKAALAGDPDLLADKSIVLDLAYEEFCLRTEAGHQPDPVDYCNQFPAYRSSLRRLLSAHDFLADIPELIQHAPKIRWPEEGDAFGDFTLLRELGRGSFARVFLATEASTGNRLVAVKLSLEGNSEAHTLGRLDHPNIVPILSARQDESGLSVVCMPFFGKATLHDVLDRAFPKPESTPPDDARVILDAVRAETADDPRLPSRRPDTVLERHNYVDGVVHLAIQMTDALAFIHGRGICHRDLKPSNVLLDSGGRPLLLDFNLSSDIRVSGSRACGTLPYMAPEQVSLFMRTGENSPSKHIDGRADLFSLGVVIYELLTGKNPFGPLPLGQRPEELATLLVERHRKGCRPLRSFNPAVEPELAQLIECCLAQRPAQRPVDAATLAAGLRRHFARSHRLRRWVSRRPGLVAAVACTIVLVAGAASWSAANRPPAWVRAHDQGRLAFLDGDFAKAGQLFEKALTENNQHAASWFARGCTQLAQDQVELAVVSFDKANKLRRDGATLSCMAYCQIRSGHFREAVVYADQAVQVGDAAPGLFNNRAYALLKIGKAVEAAPDLKRVLDGDPNFVPARYNRAMQLLQSAFANPGVALPNQAQIDIGFVLDQCEPTADLYRDAAYIFAAASNSPDDDRANKSVEYFRLALERGHDGAALRGDPLLKMRLKGHPAFPALLEARGGGTVNPLAPNYRLCYPVAGLPD